MHHLKFTLILILLQTLLYAEWEQVIHGDIPLIMESASSIDASDPNTVAFATYNGVRFTNDGGQTWLYSRLPDWEITTFNLTDISVVDGQHIWCSTSDPGKIYASTDSGNSWSVQYHDSLSTNDFRYIEMFDLNNGIAMGNPNGTGPALFLVTLDGGITWTSVNDSLGPCEGENWQAIDFVSTEEGFYQPCWEEIQYTHVTHDGCANWSKHGHTVRGQAIGAYNRDIALAAKYAKLQHTRDGGLSWYETTSPSNSWVLDVEFSPTNPSFVWIMSTLDVLFSQDTGRTWIEQEIGFINPVDMVMVDDQNGWILTKQGLWNTTNAGVTGVQSYGLQIKQPTLFPAFPNPFNPTTTLSYELPAQSNVTLTVSDITGRARTTLVQAQQPAGYYEFQWSGTDDSGYPVSTGVYFCRLQAGDYSKTIKMVYLK